MSTNFQSLSVVRQEKNRPILFGVALTKNQLSDRKIRKYATYIFDSVTCIDEMKTSEVRRNINSISDYTNPSSYSFTEANYIMDFAKSSSMKVSGNTLWDDHDTFSIPYLNNLTTSATDKSTMSNILNNHVTTTINHFQTRYPNQIYSWQVLNEAPSLQANRILGAVYFSNLYTYAKTAVSSTKIKLFYNDSFKNIDTYETTLLTLKKEEKIHGLGIQCRVSSTDINSAATLNQILTEIENITKKYRAYGFDVHYTEIDFDTTTLNYNFMNEFYARLLDIALRYGVSNFTVWGLKDDLSPLWSSGRPKYPLLLDSLFRPKPSYTAMLNKLKDYRQLTTDYDIFIILGQSNSVGYGKTIDRPRIGSIMDDDYNNKEDANIKQWSNYPIISGKKPEDEIIPAKERLYHLDPGTNSDYGFGVSFARQYIREGKLSPNRKILLIGCGWNATGFLTITNSDAAKRARSGHWRVMTTAMGPTEVPRLYDMSLDRIRSAISPGNVGPNSILRGIFWVQGEADAVAAVKTARTTPLAPSPSCPRSPLDPKFMNRPVNLITADLNRYETYLTEMLNKLRTNLTNYINNVRTFNVPRQFPNAIPILIGSIPNLKLPCNYRDDYLYVIEILKNIPSKGTITNSKFVPSDIISGTVFNSFLTTGPPDEKEDDYHYTKSSQIEFGKRFFYFYNNLSISIDTDYDIFIVMGQSNSVGLGVLVDSSIPKIGTSMMNDDYNNIEDPNIKMFDGTQFIPGKERMFHITSQPTPTEPTTYYGFGVSFARQYVKESKLLPNRKVLLIGCGYHGSGVLRTTSHHWHSTLRTAGGYSLYDATIRRVRTAINLPGVGRGSQIKGILWHQGETDAKYIHKKEYLLITPPAPVVTYNDYKRELKNSLNGLRNEFTTIINTKRTSLPAQVATSIPILLGSILTESTNAELRNRGLDLMVPVIKEVADDPANINYSFVPVTPISGTVFTKTLTGFGQNATDWIHFNKSSEIEFGKRYYYIYNNNRITIF